ncbi:MAG: hypothetical protein ACQEXX_26070 [Bacillota bacterium]
MFDASVLPLEALKAQCGVYMTAIDHSTGQLPEEFDRAAVEKNEQKYRQIHKRAMEGLIPSWLFIIPVYS